MIAEVRFDRIRLRGAVELPSSKSISNRLLLLKALTGSPAEIGRLSEANDTKLLRHLLDSSEEQLDARDAGTVYRFLTAYLAFRHGNRTLTGTERMLQRPIGILVDALRQLGARIEYAGREGYPPIRIEGGRLQGGEVRVDGSVSSQFVTALLLVAPFLAEGLTLNLEGNQVSATYVSMTLALLQRMGVPVERRGTRIRVEPFVVTFTDAEVESDWSSAAFFFEAACMAREAELELNRLTEDSIQGDARLKDLAALFGLEGRFTCSGWNIGKSGVGQSQLDLNLCGEPDLFPALCAGAAGSGIKARFTGLGHLRIKESDRLLAMEENLLLLGADCAIYDDGFLLRRSDTLRTDGVLLNGFSDHRIVMALAVMAVRCGFVRITDAEQVAKSFPGFWDELRKLGFDVHLVP